MFTVINAAIPETRIRALTFMVFVVVTVVNAPMFNTPCSMYSTMSRNKNMTKNFVESAPFFFKVNFNSEDGSAVL
jgi:hypothetical protein